MSIRAEYKQAFEGYAFIVSQSCFVFFFFSSRRRHTRFDCDWSSDVCSSDLKRQPASAAVVMDGPGDQFLARPALPGDQHVALGVGHLADHLEHFPHRLALDRKSVV